VCDGLLSHAQRSLLFAVFKDQKSVCLDCLKEGYVEASLAIDNLLEIQTASYTNDSKILDSN
jgi:hypothetical protein